MRITSTISLILLIITGCSQSAAAPDVKVRLLGDRSDAKYEWVFAFHGEEVIAQRHIFPGYEQPIIFSYSTATQAIPDEFLAGPGNVQPPFLPGGPWFYRIDVPLDESAGIRTVFFGSDTDKLRHALSNFAITIQSRGERLEALPAWIAESPELRSNFGHD